MLITGSGVRTVCSQYINVNCKATVLAGVFVFFFLRGSLTYFHNANFLVSSVHLGKLQIKNSRDLGTVGFKKNSEWLILT
jgi:hypothetical protein